MAKAFVFTATMSIASAFGPARANAFDANLSWSRVGNATGYNVYVRYDTKAFVKSTGPDGTGGSGGSVQYLLTGLPLGPKIFFTVTARDAAPGEESNQSNELFIDYAMAAKVVDSDADGLTDAEEDVNLNRKRDNGETDRLAADSDLDGLSDGAEVTAGLDPLSGDSDNDGTGDARDTCHDVDRDGFGAPGISTSTCPIDNCPTVSNPGQRDGDGDGMGEVCDPCTNVSKQQDFSFKPKLIFRKVNFDTVSDDDVMTVKGDFHLANGTGFAAIDPATQGARVVAMSRDDAEVVDIAIPPGGFNVVSKRGWKVNRTHDVWKYIDKGTNRVNGIAKVVVKDQNNKERRLVRLLVKGKGGDYPVVAGDAPLNASVVLGDTTASQAGRCGETNFASGECQVLTGGRIIACERE